MSVCFVPYMPQAIAMWPSQNSSQSSSQAPQRSLPSCRASSSAFTFPASSSRVAPVEPPSPLFLQQSGQTLPSPTHQHLQGFSNTSPTTGNTATTPLSWKDYPLSSAPSSMNNFSSATTVPTSMGSPTRYPSSGVQYTREKMHVYSGDLSPLEQCRLRTWPLRQWIYQHRKNPYPTKADKKLLAKMANLREDQVNMWFANTRRRIKKVGMRSWSGGMFDDFQTKAISDAAEASLARANALTSDGCSSDEESFISGGSTGSDIAFQF